MTISAEQRAWLKSLGALVGEPSGDALAKEPEDDSPKGIVRGGQDKALLGGLIPGLGDIKSITSRITIKNKSGVALRIVQGSGKLENLTASFVRSPPIDIAAASEAEFSVTNEPSLSPIPTGGTGGEIKYDVVDDDKKTRLFMKWERGGIAPSRKTAQTITPDDGRFKLDGANSGEDFQFDLSSKGGTPPGPTPPGPTPPGPTPPGPGPAPGPGPTPAVQSGCMILVTNQTSLTLKRADAKHERGDFMLPPDRKSVV